MKKYKVAFATGSRADYGIVRNYITLLNNDPCIDFSVLATGALLSSKYGLAENIVKKDGFKISYRLPTSLNVNSNAATTKIMSKILDHFGQFFEKNKYDLLIILGDRYEIYAVTIAAAMQRIPILHLHGGEQTLANYDEFIRHSITKMSCFHITSTNEYRNRVIQLGEHPNKVFNLGALGAENCKKINLANVPVDIKVLKNCFCVLFHPETLNKESPLVQVQELTKAISKFINDYKFVFISSNADTHSNLITDHILDFCKKNNNAIFYKNLHPDAYHYLLKKSIALIGNSSSGIIEAPSLNCLTINIGDRQTGRVKSQSIIDVSCNEKNIFKAIRAAITSHQNFNFQNPYYKPNTAKNYYRVTKKILEKISNISFKEFYNLKIKK